MWDLWGTKCSGIVFYPSALVVRIIPPLFCPRISFAFHRCSIISATDSTVNLQGMKGMLINKCVYIYPSCPKREYTILHWAFKLVSSCGRKWLHAKG